MDNESGDDSSKSTEDISGIDAQYAGAASAQGHPHGLRNRLDFIKTKANGHWKRLHESFNTWRREQNEPDNDSSYVAAEENSVEVSTSAVSNSPSIHSADFRHKALGIEETIASQSLHCGSNKETALSPKAWQQRLEPVRQEFSGSTHATPVSPLKEAPIPAAQMVHGEQQKPSAASPPQPPPRLPSIQNTEHSSYVTPSFRPALLPRFVRQSVEYSQSLTKTQQAMITKEEEKALMESLGNPLYSPREQFGQCDSLSDTDPSTSPRVNIISCGHKSHSVRYVNNDSDPRNSTEDNSKASDKDVLEADLHSKETSHQQIFEHDTTMLSPQLHGNQQTTTGNISESQHDPHLTVAIATHERKPTPTLEVECIASINESGPGRVISSRNVAAPFTVTNGSQNTMQLPSYLEPSPLPRSLLPHKTPTLLTKHEHSPQLRNGHASLTITPPLSTGTHEADHEFLPEKQAPSHGTCLEQTMRPHPNVSHLSPKRAAPQPPLVVHSTVVQYPGPLRGYSPKRFEERHPPPLPLPPHRPSLSPTGAAPCYMYCDMEPRPYMPTTEPLPRRRGGIPFRGLSSAGGQARSSLVTSLGSLLSSLRWKSTKFGDGMRRQLSKLSTSTASQDSCGSPADTWRKARSSGGPWIYTPAEAKNRSLDNIEEDDQPRRDGEDRDSESMEAECLCGDVYRTLMIQTACCFCWPVGLTAWCLSSTAMGRSNGPAEIFIRTMGQHLTCYALLFGISFYFLFMVFIVSLVTVGLNRP